MKRTLIVVVVVAVLVIGFLLYRSHETRDYWHPDPHAREEIEKAKRR